MTSSVARKRLALFASGRGSNGEALYKAMQEGYINGEFVVIITDHGDAGGLLNVLNLGIFHSLSSSVATMILKLALNKPS